MTGKVQKRVTDLDEERFFKAGIKDLGGYAWKFKKKKSVRKDVREYLFSIIK